jgi:hypothetical protein
MVGIQDVFNIQEYAMPSHWRHDKISEARKPTGKFCGNSTLLEGFLTRRNSMFHSSFLGSGKCMEIGKI